MSELNPFVARKIIDTVGAQGEPPDYGLQFFTAGLDSYLSVIDQEYLSSFVAQGGSAFKMVVGIYGGGKTHFLYCIRDLAWKYNFAVSYVSLSPGESPFHRLEFVYKAIVRGIIPPPSPEELLKGYERGIASYLRYWYSQKYQEYKSKHLKGEELREALLYEVDHLEGTESVSFLKAVRAAFKALLNRQEEDFEDICQWLTGEGYDRRLHAKHGILQRIDKTTAFIMIRSLVQWIKQIGFSGLIVLLDEAERVPSLSTKQKEQHMSNLREVIDECGHMNFQGVMVYYAVPDENFLEGRAQVYEALKQRVATVFETLNPTGVKIELEKVVTDPISFLCEVGSKLTEVYEVAYGHTFDGTECEQVVETIAKDAYEERHSDIGYKRLFVQRLIKGLHFLRQQSAQPTLDDLR